MICQDRRRYRGYVLMSRGRTIACTFPAGYAAIVDGKRLPVCGTHRRWRKARGHRIEALHPRERERMSTIVHGASDDLIEIDGDIREEFEFLSNGDRDALYIGFSDGTVLQVRYDNQGCWRIERTIEGRAEYRHEPAVAPNSTARQDGTPGHSDVVRLQGKIAWAIAGEQIARPSKQEATGGQG